MQLNTKKGSFITLLPFLVFVITYLFTGIYLIKKGAPMGFYGFKTPISSNNRDNTCIFNNKGQYK